MSDEEPTRSDRRRNPELRGGQTEFQLLRVLADEGEWLRADELLDELPRGTELDRGRLGSVLWGLWIRDLVERRYVAGDGRTSEYRIAEAGTTALDNVADRAGDP